MIDKAEGSEGAEKEMEELNALLPEIQEKVEDAVEGQKMASVAESMVRCVGVGVCVHIDLVKDVCYSVMTKGSFTYVL